MPFIYVKKKSRKEIYGKGCEAQKLAKNYPRYQEDYKNCQVYIGFNKPDQSFYVNLGEEYNIRYQKLIKCKRMPKFNRDIKRNMGLAVWFFEDLLPDIRPWLVEAKNFPN